MKGAVLRRIGARLVRLDTTQENPAALTDATGKYRDFFAGHGVRANLVRPDYYIFGAVADLDELPGLVAELEKRISLSLPRRARRRGSARKAQVLKGRLD